MSFVGELKRRNVFKIGVAYLVVAWLLAQIVSVFAPALRLPEWVVSFVALLLILAFPLALLLAWVYELTPEGLKRTKDVQPADSLKHVTGGRLNYVIIGALVLVLALVATDSYVLTGGEAERADRPPSIAAVVPAGEPAAGEPAASAPPSAALLPADAAYSAPPSAELRLEITTPPTDDPWSIAVAPDGRSVAFVASSAAGSMLWLRQLDADRPQAIEGTEGASSPFWSPDGRLIGFIADGYVQQVEVVGSAVRRLAAATVGQGGTWNRDGTLLFAPNRSGPIMSIATPGATPVPVTRLERTLQQGHTAPEFLPDGQHFLYFVQGTPDTRGIYLTELGNLTARRLLDADAKGAYLPSGFLLFVRQTTLFAQRFDLSRLELTGAPLVVAEGVMADLGPNRTALSASAAGSFVYRLGAVAESQLVWFDRSGQRLGAVGDRQRPAAWSPAISPDERRVAVYLSAGGNTDIWVFDVERGFSSRFTFDSALDNTPIWSPDGTSIVFTSSRNGTLNLYRKAATGAGDEELLLSSDRNKVPNDWSRDGRYLLYRVTGDDSSYDLYALPLEGEPRSLDVATTNFDERDAQFSPDGGWVAYQSNESGRFEIYVQPFPGPGGKTLVSAAGGAQARFGPDGRELFYVSLDGQLMAVPIELGSDGESLRAGEPVPLFAMPLRGGAVQTVDVAQYAVSRDGQRFLINTDVTETTSSITVVLNWAPKAP